MAAKELSVFYTGAGTYIAFSNAFFLSGEGAKKVLPNAVFFIGVGN